MRFCSVKTWVVAFLLMGVPLLGNAKPCCSASVKKTVTFKKNIAVNKQGKKRLPYRAISSRRAPAWYLDVGLGGVLKQKMGSNYLLPISNDASDQYVSAKGKKVPLLLLGAGYVWSRAAAAFPFTSLGAEYSYAFASKLLGAINNKSTPEAHQNDYQFSASHHNARLVVKSDVYRWQQFLPYVAAGLGLSWNQVSNYKEIPIGTSAQEHTDPKFPSGNKLNFSYSLGTGIDYIFSKTLWGSLGYRYDQFAGFKTKPSAEEKNIGRVFSNKLSGHSVLLSLRYLFA